MRAAVIALMLAVAACSTGAPSVAPTTTSPAASAPTTTEASQLRRLLAVGDSFTIGEGVEPDQAWPAQLIAALASEDVAAEIELRAGTGWTASRAASELERETLAGTFDMAFIGVGVNDHFHEFGVANMEAGLQRIAAAVLRVVAAPSDVVVLSMADWRVTPRGAEYAAGWRSADPAEYNAALAAFAAANGFQFVDITRVSLAQADDPSLVAGDGLHASAELYARWIDTALMPAALDRLRG